jgi:hypothetical protein
VEPAQVLAFRLARQGLADRAGRTLAEAAAWPASDVTRGTAALALAARADGVTREACDRTVDAGELVVAPSLRAALHAQAPADAGLWGRALLASEEAELREQLGAGAQRHLDREGLRAVEALEEVARATEEALAGGRALGKDELHEELRGRVRGELLPWCEGCRSHHVSPMLWRYAGVRVGMRMDAARRFVLGAPAPPARAVDAARRFLRAYGPSTAKDLGAWAGLARAQARRLWAELGDELAEVRVDGRRAWVLREDEAALASPPEPRGVRLLPARDPFLQQPDRATLAPDPELRRRLFRPMAGPGAVLQDGRLAGLWRVRARGRGVELEVEELERLDRDALEAEAARVALARGAEGADVRVG